MRKLQLRHQLCVGTGGILQEMERDEMEKDEVRMKLYLVRPASKQENVRNLLSLVLSQALALGEATSHGSGFSRAQSGRTVYMVASQ